MKNVLLVSTAMGLVLVGGAARAQSQNDDGTWDGPGYYLEDRATMSDGTSSLFKDGGPFPSLEACQAYWRQQSQTQSNPAGSLQCIYRATETTYDPCFLTTACVRHAGLLDDCEELTVMRAFRDRYLSRFEEGRVLIDHYYRVAPRIVERIRQRPDQGRVLNWVLREVRATARTIGRGDSEEAIARYAVMVSRLGQHCGTF
jgi:hypothetical protein